MRLTSGTPPLPATRNVTSGAPAATVAPASGTASPNAACPGVGDLVVAGVAGDGPDLHAPDQRRPPLVAGAAGHERQADGDALRGHHRLGVRRADVIDADPPLPRPARTPSADRRRSRRWPACTVERPDRGPGVQLDGDVAVAREGERPVADPDARRRHLGGAPRITNGSSMRTSMRASRVTTAVEPAGMIPNVAAALISAGRQREPPAERREADAGEQDDPRVRQPDAEGRPPERAVAEADRAAHRRARSWAAGARARRPPPTRRAGPSPPSRAA